MGAGMIGILLLVIIVAVIVALAYAGVGASLWKRRTDPDADLTQPDLVAPEATERRHDPERYAAEADDRREPEKNEPFPSASDTGGMAETGRRGRR